MPISVDGMSEGSLKGTLVLLYLWMMKVRVPLWKVNFIIKLC